MRRGNGTELNGLAGLDRLIRRIQVANPMKKERTDASFGVWGGGVSLDALVRYAARDYKGLLKNDFDFVYDEIKNFPILPPTFMREYSRYDERLAVFEKYLDAFLRYWGTYPDNVYEPANSWAEFKQRLETLKAFRINSLLQNIYARCLNILKDIDDTFLSDVLKRQKADYAALVNDELNMLTPLFTDAGQKALNAWAELPDDPEQAWNKLTSMSDRELKNSFLNVYTTAPHSKIG